MNSLIVNTSPEVDVRGTIQMIREKDPKSRIVVLTSVRTFEQSKRTLGVQKVKFYNNDLRGVVALFSNIKFIKKKKINNGFICQTQNDHRKIQFMQKFYIALIGVFLQLSGVKNIYFLDAENHKCKFNTRTLMASLYLSVFKIVFAPPIAFFRAPYFFCKVFLKKFILAKENKDDEFIGFGPLRKLSGHTYFLARAKMANKFGLFGINHQDYMGTPVTLHRSPLDALFLSKLGYKKFVGLTSILISLSFIWIILETENYYFFLFLPFVFLSTYFIKSIFVSHLEFLAWGFLSLSLVSLITGNLVLSSLFFALTVLSHIGIALIGGAIIVSIMGFDLFTSFNMDTLFSVILNFLFFSIIVGAITAFLILPFLRTRHKISRNELINKFYAWKGTWNIITLTEAITYSMFVLSVFVFVPFNNLHIMVLIPLIALYINSKVRWLWSAYTIELSMVVMGTIFILYYPNLIALLIFTYLIYTSPVILIRGLYDVNHFEIRIHPITLGESRTNLLDMFSSVPDGERVALEGGRMDVSRLKYLFNAHLSYILVEREIELLNGFGPEFVEENIFLNIVQHLDKTISKDKLEYVLKAGGANFILVYDPEFREKLTAFGYEMVGSVDCRDWIQIDEPGPTITLFKAPFKTTIVEPTVNLITAPNELRFEAKKGVAYLLKYNYYPGWRAYQEGSRVQIEDVHPGMKLTAISDAPMLLEYKYKNYWSR